MAKYVSFSAVVSETIRQCVKVHEKAKLKRAKLFEERDGVEAQLDSLDATQTKKRQELEAEGYQCIRAIEDQQAIIKAAVGKIMEVAASADDPEFEWGDDVKITGAQLLKAKKPKDDDDDPEQKEIKPSARAKEPNSPGRAKNDGYTSVAFSKVRVQELELGDGVTAKLVAGKCETIGDVQAAMEVDGLRDIEGIGGATAAEITKAVRRLERKCVDGELKVAREEAAAS